MPLRRGAAQVRVAALSAAQNTVTLNASVNSNTQMWIGSRPNWAAYTVSVPITLADNNGNAGVNVHIEALTNPAPNDSGALYFAGIEAPGAGNQVVIGAEVSGWHPLTTAPGTFNPGTPYTLQVTIAGNAISVSVDGTAYASFTDTTYDMVYGSMDIRTYNSTATYGPVTVTCN